MESERQLRQPGTYREIAGNQSQAANRYREIAGDLSEAANLASHPEAAALLRRLAQQYVRLAMFAEDSTESLQPPDLNPDRYSSVMECRSSSRL